MSSYRHMHPLSHMSRGQRLVMLALNQQTKEKMSRASASPVKHKMLSCCHTDSTTKSGVHQRARSETSAIKRKRTSDDRSPVPTDSQAVADADDPQVTDSVVTSEQLLADLDPPASNNSTTKSGVHRRAKSGTSATEQKRMKYEQMREKHGVLPPCNCKRNCISKFSDEQRHKINAEFWQLNWNERKLFVINSVRHNRVGRRTSASQSQRSVTMHYFLHNGVESVVVCKVFYLTTLGYPRSNDFFVYHALKSVVSGDTCITPKPDGRGKAPAVNKIDRAMIMNHIESYHPCVSHYRRQHAPNRRYLPSDISMHAMHADFKSRHGNICSYDLYRKVLKEMNISFTRLGHEECEQCEAFKMHNRDHNQENLCDLCDLCQRWKTHIEKAKRSRSEYDKDRDSQDVSEPVFSADLQKVIMLPRMESFKSVLFTRRIIVLNESFVPLGSKTAGSNFPMAVLWHEGIAGRKKEEIISAFHSFLLHKRDQKVITLWVDNCSGQNKNWALFCFLVYIVNSSETLTDVIRLKFFEPGHTFMSADSFHHQVEKSLREKDKVYDFDDYVSCVLSSNSGKVFTKSMQVQDFCDWTDFSSTYKLNRTTPRPYLSDMVYIEVNRGQNGLVYRTDFDGLDIPLNFVNARATKSGVPRPVQRTKARGIPADKKSDILAKLGHLMPKNRLSFWQNIETVIFQT